MQTAPSRFAAYDRFAVYAAVDVDTLPVYECPACGLRYAVGPNGGSGCRSCAADGDFTGMTVAEATAAVALDPECHGHPTPHGTVYCELDDAPASSMSDLQIEAANAVDAIRTAAREGVDWEDEPALLRAADLLALLAGLDAE